MAKRPARVEPAASLRKSRRELSFFVMVGSLSRRAGLPVEVRDVEGAKPAPAHVAS
jgi:hypothetical protein